MAEQRYKLMLVRLFGRLLPTLSLDNGLDLSQLSPIRRVTTAWGLAMLEAIALVEALGPAS